VYQDFLILGGAGLVGLQVCRHIVTRMSPRRIVVASLVKAEAEDATRKLRAEFGDKVAFVPEHGNLFVPTDLAHLGRDAILADVKLRRRMLAFVYDDFEAAYQSNHLARLIERHRPEVVVDCVNTATGFSYQDVFDGAAKVRDWITDEGFSREGLVDLDAFLLSQTSPQLIRHVRIVHRATTEHQTRVYLKVGTTGTGGMGMNIPYTHSEDKPSQKLLAKTETAFGHTGLLFLLARTPDAPIVKEVKPAAMIGYRAVTVREVSDKHGNSDLYDAHEVPVGPGATLDLQEPAAGYEAVGRLRVPVVDTGENGLFTRGEFAAITALGQMEYITPEEIARTVVHEIRGANTGNDVISAVDASVLQPTYKAGLLRSSALTDLNLVEADSGVPSVALGRLGPPELSKLLFEAQLFKHAFATLSAASAETLGPEALSDALVGALVGSGVRAQAPSIGIPILLPDGKRILRGPRINVPELGGHRKSVAAASAAELDAWVKKGWVDLRPSNMAAWQARFRQMVQSRADLREAGSAASTIHTYLGDTFEIGEVVAWIFNNEMGGYRVK
jgi:hypothetical protein